MLKQLVASGSVITSLYSLRLRLGEYRLVITSPLVTNCQIDQLYSVYQNNSKPN